MLKRNIDVEAGLVNGVVGVVTGFDKINRDQGVHISSVNVKFENIQESIKIERISSTFEVLKNIFFTRKQFPLILAFAITVHKSQGLSLTTAIVDIGHNCFGSGMAYVALSRVTSLNGLHLVDIDRCKIIANRKALSEYNRLRMLHTPHLGRLPLPKRKNMQIPQNDLPADDTLLHAGASQSPKQVHVDERTTGSTEVSSKRMKRPRKSTITDETITCHSTVTQTQNPSLLSSPPTANIYRYCEIASLDQDFQRRICDEMNLQYSSAIRRQRKGHKSPISEKLEHLIYSQTNTYVNCHLSPTTGDGNCLFRAISEAVACTDEYHDKIRHYIVNHMLDVTINTDIENLFASRNNQQQSFHQHLETMKRLGTWGTEQEIVAAAHLFNCSILCCSQYNTTGRLCIQHFPPHFASNPTCAATCHHKSLYLVNTNSHYEPVTVLYKLSPASHHNITDVEP